MYGRLLTFNDQGMRGVGCCGPRRTLAGITAAQAYEAAKSAESNLNPKDYQSNPNFSDSAVAAVIESGSLPGNWANPGGACAGRAPNLNLFQTASGLALGTTSAGIGIASAAGAVSAATAGLATAAVGGVGAIVGLIEVIFAHHAAAVKQEDEIYCAALPAAANAFALILQAVQNGSQTPQQGIDALNELLSKFESVIAPSYGHSPYCNALCEQKIMLDAYVRYWTAQFQGMPATSGASSGTDAAAVPGTATGGTTAAAPISTGEKIALSVAAVFALIFVGRALA